MRRSGGGPRNRDRAQFSGKHWEMPRGDETIKGKGVEAVPACAVCSSESPHLFNPLKPSTLKVPDQPLILSIRDLIRNEGPISFARFMEQALYHPAHGYYSSGRCTIGRRGDYFTSVSVGPLFGEMLAEQFAEIWRRLGCPNDFVIVEQGAHHGVFATDVLETLRNSSPELFATTRSRIVEPVPVLRQRQQGVLRQFARTAEWSASLEAMEPFSGVHFSNELVDAMPVHLIVAAGAAERRECHERLVQRT